MQRKSKGNRGGGVVPVASKAEGIPSSLRLCVTVAMINDRPKAICHTCKGSRHHHPPLRKFRMLIKRARSRRRTIAPPQVANAYPPQRSFWTENDEGENMWKSVTTSLRAGHCLETRGGLAVKWERVPDPTEGSRRVLIRIASRCVLDTEELFPSLLFPIGRRVMANARDQVQLYMIEGCWIA